MFYRAYSEKIPEKGPMMNVVATTLKLLKLYYLMYYAILYVRFHVYKMAYNFWSIMLTRPNPKSNSA